MFTLPRTMNVCLVGPHPPRDLELQTLLLSLSVGVQRLLCISLIIMMKPFSWTN